MAVDALGEFPGVVPFQHSVYQRLAEALDVAVAPPGGHGAAQLVGIARRKAGGDHGELHDLLLENRHAEGALQHRFHRVARVLHRLDTVPPPQVRMHHIALDRSRAHDRDFDHEVVEINRLQPRQHAHLRPRLDLKHADGVGVPDHLVHLRILGWNIGQGQRFPSPGADQIQSAPNGGQHA